MTIGKRQSIGFPDMRFEDERLNRLMEFIRGMANEVQRLQQLLRAGQQGQVLTKKTGTDYDGIWAAAGNVPTVTGAQNIGSGKGLFAGNISTILQFKTLIQGANITLTAAADSITIDASTTLGGGTVTSVDISSDDLDVTGSPITTAGTIHLTIGANKVTYDRIQQTTVDSVVLGRRSGEGAGNVEELSGTDLQTILGLASSSGYPPQLAYAGIV